MDECKPLPYATPMATATAPEKKVVDNRHSNQYRPWLNTRMNAHADARIRFCRSSVKHFLDREPRLKRKQSADVMVILSFLLIRIPPLPDASELSDSSDCTAAQNAAAAPALRNAGTYRTTTTQIHPPYQLITRKA